MEPTVLPESVSDESKEVNERIWETREDIGDRGSS